MTSEARQCRNMISEALIDYGMPSSESAIRLLCMIAAHESGGFTYVKQVKGPAVSLFQIEPATYADLCLYAKRRGFLVKESDDPPEQLIFNTALAAAFGRLFFLRIKAPIPNKDDIYGLAKYAKKYWNTNLGKATWQMYANAYRDNFQC